MTVEDRIAVAASDGARRERGGLAAAGVPRVRVVNLTKRFRRTGAEEVIPVNNVTLSLGADEMVVLLGPSGCGKTTLLRCVAGLERPDEGEIYIDDQLVFSSEQGVFVPPNKRSLSMVFQSYALWPHMTVFENVAYPLRARHASKEQVRRGVSEALKLVGLGHLAKQHPGQISGGQQQRVALARAIVAGSGVVLFDEPLSNVDAKVRELLRIQLVEMQRELGFSALYVTHDQTEAMALADRIVVLNEGVVAQVGEPAEVYQLPVSRYVGTFIGSANLWEGKVRSREDTRVVVTTSIGDVLVDAVRQVEAGQDIPAPGAGVVVLSRPEKLRLSAAPPADATAENTWECVVAAKLLLGSQTEYVVRIGEGERARVWTADVDGLAEGQTAWLSLPPGEFRVLRSDGSSDEEDLA